MNENIYSQKIDEIIKSHFVLPATHPKSFIDYNEPHDEDIGTENSLLKELLGRSNFLNDVFDHLRASPNHKEKFASYYCFLSEAVSFKNKEQDKNITNYNEENAQACIDKLIESSKKETNAHYLIGPKGAGKTFFINYLVSFFKDRFIDNKIIYVRTSLLKRDEEEQIVDRVARQALIILSNHYYKDGPLKISEFEGYLRHNEPRLLTDGEFDTDIKNFMHELDGRRAPLQLFKHMHRHILEQGYKFLFIIDGLDAVEPTTEEEQRFDDWFQEVMRFAQGELPFDGGWLFVARDDSYHKHFSNQKSLAATRSLGQFNGEKFEIKPPCIFVALKKRAEYHAHIFQKEYDRDKTLGIRSIHAIVAKMVARSFTIDKLHTRQQVKVGFIPKHKDSSRPDDYEIYAKLSDIFAGDIRKAFYTCHIVLLASISMHITKKRIEIKYVNSDDVVDALLSLVNLSSSAETNSSQDEPIYLSQVYRLVHPFVCGLNLYCVPPFQYRIVEGGLINRLTNGYNIESGTMPNLYQMDMDFILRLSGNDSHKIVMSKFAKIIVLVYFFKYSLNLNGANRRIGKYLIDTNLSEIFDQAIIDVAMKELMYFNAIKKAKSSSKSYVLSDGGEFYVQYFLWNSDYLACIMNTISVPGFLFDGDKNTIFKYLSDDEISRKLNSTILDSTTLSLNCKRHFNRILIARYLEWSWNDCLLKLEDLNIEQKFKDTFTHIKDGLNWLKEDAITKASRLYASHSELAQKLDNNDFPRSLGKGLSEYKNMVTQPRNPNREVF